MSVEKLPDYNAAISGDSPAPEYPDGESGDVNVNVPADESSLLNFQGGDAPPSYTSIYGQIKDAKTNSSSNVGFVKVVVGILVGSVIGLICLGVMAAFPIAQLVIGIKYKDLCPIQKNIPIWLIASGAVGICQVLLGMLQRLFTKKDSEGNQSGGGCCALLLNLIHVGGLALFIAGNVWVYKVHNTVSYNPDNSTVVNGTIVDSFYCDKTCYLFAFWSITVVYIMLGVSLLLCCIGCICLCVVS